MMNSVVLLNKGIQCLMDNLGLVEAERFITLIHAEHFDYTEWRQDNLFNDLSVEELSRAAMEYRKRAKINTGV